MINSIYRKRKRIISSFLVAMLLTGCSSSKLLLSNKESDGSEEEIRESGNDADDEAARDISIDASAKNSSSEEKSSDEKLLVDSVTWDDSYAPAGNSDDYNKVFFNMSDGSVQTFEISSYYMVEDLQMADLDNDGTDDYIINAYFADTATEYSIIYAYTFEDGEVSQLFPVSGIEGVDDAKTYDCQIVEVSIDGEILNALRLTSYSKVEGIVYGDAEAQIYFLDGQWNLQFSYESKYGAYSAFTSPRDKNFVSIDDESSKLYEDFLNDSVEARFDKDGDNGEFLVLSEALEDGESYTLSQITDFLTGQDQYGEGWGVESISDSYIDCGLDDQIEMVVNVDFEGNGDEFSLSMVISNISGELVISFCADSWSRSQTQILYNGEVSSYGSGGASSHGGYTGFINSNGKYVHWYTEWEEGIEAQDDGIVSINYWMSDDYKDYQTVTFKLPDGYSYVYQESFSFNNDYYDYSDRYYYFYIVDENYNEYPDNPDDPDNPYNVIREAHQEAGIKVVSSDEYEELITQRRSQIGITDEVYSFGRQYLPDED